MMSNINTRLVALEGRLAQYMGAEKGLGLDLEIAEKAGDSREDTAPTRMAIEQFEKYIIAVQELIKEEKKGKIIKP